MQKMYGVFYDYDVPDNEAYGREYHTRLLFVTDDLNYAHSFVDKYNFPHPLGDANIDRIFVKEVKTSMSETYMEKELYQVHLSKYDSDDATIVCRRWHRYLATDTAWEKFKKYYKVFRHTEDGKEIELPLSFCETLEEYDKALDAKYRGDD